MRLTHAEYYPLTDQERTECCTHPSEALTQNHKAGTYDSQTLLLIKLSSRPYRPNLPMYRGTL